MQKQQDDLARAALERSLSNEQLTANFAQQLEDQKAFSNHVILESESLEDRLNTLEKEDQIERLLEDLKSRQPRLS